MKSRSKTLKMMAYQAAYMLIHYKNGEERCIVTTVTRPAMKIRSGLEIPVLPAAEKYDDGLAP